MIMQVLVTGRNSQGDTTFVKFVKSVNHAVSLRQNFVRASSEKAISNAREAPFLVGSAGRRPRPMIRIAAIQLQL